MKLLTVAIPCYNSSEYMDKSIRSAISGGDRVEVVVVDDGSSDNTLEIANKYQKKFPDIVKVVHQENGGHGEAVNTGITNWKICPLCYPNLIRRSFPQNSSLLMIF